MCLNNFLVITSTLKRTLWNVLCLFTARDKLEAILETGQINYRIFKFAADHYMTFWNHTLENGERKPPTKQDAYKSTKKTNLKYTIQTSKKTDEYKIHNLKNSSFIEETTARTVIHCVSLAQLNMV